MATPNKARKPRDESRAARGRYKPEAVFRIATSDIFTTDRVARLDEVLAVFTEIMRGHFHHWADLGHMQPSAKVGAILAAAQNLCKHWGGFQKPSENERDREWRATQYTAAALSIREDKIKEGKPADPESIWSEMLTWAEYRECSQDLKPFQADICEILRRADEREMVRH